MEQKTGIWEAHAPGWEIVERIVERGAIQFEVRCGGLPVAAAASTWTLEGHGPRGPGCFAWLATRGYDWNARESSAAGLEQNARVRRITLRGTVTSESTHHCGKPKLYSALQLAQL
jgi:hypothetical protein